METQKKIDYLKITMMILIGFLVLLLINQCQKEKQRISTADNLQEVMKDSLKVWRDKEGNFKAKISVFEADKASDFTKLATQDSTIRKLQKLVEENKNLIKQGGSVTIINTKGIVDVTIPTQPVDTSKIVNGWPVYESSFNLGKWVWGETIAARDSTKISLRYQDEFNLVIGREKTGFLGLGKSKPYATITSKNPYSTVKEMRVYQDAPERNKNWHIGPAAIYGLDSNFKSGLFVGAGIMWTPFNF